MNTGNRLAIGKVRERTRKIPPIEVEKTQRKLNETEKSGRSRDLRNVPNTEY
jgi:hypothetical protein